MTTERTSSRIIFTIVGVIAVVFVVGKLISAGGISLPPLSATSTPGAEEGQMASSTPREPFSYAISPIRAPRGTILAMVASTSDEQSLGLGERDALPASAGMLFPFASPGQYSFWMKDMRFSIDMVWIDENERVVGIASDVSPATYPDVFLPPSDISYVLELNSGASETFGIATGTQLKF